MCCSSPSNNLYYLTSFCDGTTACGPTCSSRTWFAAGSQRYKCGTHLVICKEGTTKCVNVEVIDAGPGISVERSANRAIVDASVAVCRELFGSSSCGWSDKHSIQAVVAQTSHPVGPFTATSQELAQFFGGGGGGGGSSPVAAPHASGGNFCPCGCDVCLYDGGSTSCASSCSGCSSDCLSCVNGGGGSGCASRCGGSNCVPPAFAHPVSEPVASSSTTCTVIGADLVNLRSQPCTTSGCTSVRLLSRGDQVQATGTTTTDSTGRTWTQISSPTNGWVATQYLSCQAHGARLEDTNSPQHSSQNPGLIAGVVIVGILALCAVIVAGVLVYSKFANTNQLERP